MFKTFLLAILLLPFTLSAQYIASYNDLNQLKSNAQLTPGQVYLIVDLNKIEIVAKTPTSFYPTPFKRTPFALDYDEETFDFNTKIITGYDNISCVARCTNGIWNLINDSNHKPYKASHCSNNLMVWYTKTYDKVISTSTDLDEGYTASPLMITCGASVGLPYIAIWLYKTTFINGQPQKTQMTLQEASIPGANIWIWVKMSNNIQL